MSQNSLRLAWAFEEVDQRLHGIMDQIYAQAKQTAIVYKDPDNLVMGSNIASFKRLAEAMLAQGCPLMNPLYNFSAGPAMVDPAVMRQIQDELLEL